MIPPLGDVTERGNYGKYFLTSLLAAECEDI
jgi:hypothetical protein